MHTKIHWARKSQQPFDMLCTIAREKIGALIRNCATDKKMIFLLQIEISLTSSMVATKSMTKLTVDRR